MFKKKTHEKFDVSEEAQDPTSPELPSNKFRAEAEEHIARIDRLRLEHAASELGTTVAEMQARAAVAEDPEETKHMLESIRESEKADKAAHAPH